MRHRSERALERLAVIANQAPGERRRAGERYLLSEHGAQRQLVYRRLAAVLGMRELAGDVLEDSKRPNFEKMIPELVDWRVREVFRDARLGSGLVGDVGGGTDKDESRGAPWVQPARKP